MGMYRKERDNNICNFIETYDGANINTIANLYFPNMANPYVMASRRLKILYDNKVLKRYRPNVNEEYVYYIDKPITEHYSKLLETYSLISKMGDIKTFSKEIKIPNAKRVIDGFIELEIEDAEYITTIPLIIEIDKTHNTSLKKLKDIYNSNYFQNKYGVFPTVVIVKKNEWDKKLQDKNMNIINLDWDLNNIGDIISDEII